MHPEPVRSKTWNPRHLSLALVVYVAAVLLAGFRAEWNLVDDALILCRYGLNASQGHGPVYNPGEHVEAHSSPLWVAMLSLGGRLGMDLPYLTRALGVLAGASVVGLASIAFGALFPPFLALMLTLIVAGDPGLSVWSVSGLETSGFTLILLATWVVLRAALGNAAVSLRVLLGGLAGLLALARPEGLVLGGLAILTLILAPPPAGAENQRSWTRTAPAWIPFVLVIAGLLTWRVAWSGSWLPSSVTGKFLPRADAMTRGLIDAGGYLFRRWPLVLVAIPAFFLRPVDDRKPDPWTKSAGVVCGFLIIEMIVAGGDWMGRDRLPGPMLPLLAMIAGTGLMTFRRSAGPPRSVLVLLAAAVLSFSWWHADQIPRNERVARVLGEWLRKSLPADTRLGVAAAGAVPFHSEFRTVDALGISSPEIAATAPPAKAPWKPGHMRYDTRKFLNERPDVIVWEFGSRWCAARLGEPARDPDRRGGDYRRELLWSREFRSEFRIMADAPAETQSMYTTFRRTGGGAAPAGDRDR